MKPGFALDLTHDTISLLHRTAQGWLEVGTADLSDPDLGNRLASLRRTALGLEPNGVTTKLILPESQILYLVVDAPGPDRASRRRQIAKALEGRTPYHPDDLVFDWSGRGDRLQVAVVARVTLQEAESFAEAHRFNPVSFVARPDGGVFVGEPFFELTTVAPKYVPKGERVDRDQGPIRILAPGPEQMPDLRQPVAVSGPAEAEPGRHRQDAGNRTDAVDPTVNTGEEAAKPGGLASDEAALERALVEALADDRKNKAGAAGDGGEGAMLLAPDDANTLAANDTTADDSKGASEKTNGGFQSRRSVNQSGPGEEASAASNGPSADNELPAVKPLMALPPVAPRINLVDAETVHIPEFSFATADVAAGNLGITAGAVPIADSTPRDALIGPTWRDPARAAGLFGRALLKTLPDTRITRPELKRDGAPVVPGQKRGGPALAAAKVRTAKINWRMLGLSAAIIVALIVVLAFLRAVSPEAGIDSTDAGVSPPPDVAALSPADDPVSESGATVPSAAPTPLAGAAPPPGDPPTADAMSADVPPVAQAHRSTVPELALASPEDAGPETVPLPETQVASLPVTTTPEPEAGRSLRDFDGGTIWSEAPAAADEPPLDPAGAPVIAVSTPGPTDAATSAIPEVARLSPDILPLPQPLPPPFDSLLRYDQNGQIIATEAGVLTPEGFTLFAGKPPLVPGARPALVSAAPADAVADLPPNPLTGKIPLARPAGLTPAVADDPAAGPVPMVPDPATEGQDADAPASTDGAELSSPSLKPRARPAAISTRVAALRATQSAIDAAAKAALQAEADASSLAVATSQRPVGRPAAMSQAIEAAIAAAVAEPEPTPEPTPDTSAATDDAVEIDEPEITTTAPDIPTSVTVTKQATIKNALNLSEVNLIGIYGSAANRRALIRMPSGKYVKVKIGDKIDGGRVAAIGDSELSYVKNGRTIVLKVLKNS